jgi:hypothetical protein
MSSVSALCVSSYIVKCHEKRGRVNRIKEREEERERKERGREGGKERKR